VTTAVIELNSLTDAIGAAAQNKNLFLRSRSGLIFLVVAAVEIRGKAFEFRGTGIDELIDRLDAEFLA
jgi:hypothetical protein